MQKTYIMTLYELMKQDKNVLSLLSDSGTEYDEILKREFPEQSLNFGISEQNLVGAAAGLANCGKIPFVYTTGAFLAYRAMEFIRDDVCFQKSNVKLVGMGSGLAWSTLGASHHTTEDISVLRALPNLTILSPATPRELMEEIHAAYRIEGPVYIRMGMSGEKEYYGNDYPFKIGESIVLRQGEDAAVFVTGSILEECMEAAAILETHNLSVKIVNVPTLKPLNQDAVLKEIVWDRPVFTVEEHNIVGGLGSIIADILAESGKAAKLRKIGLCDQFAAGYGTQREVRRQNGLHADQIAAVMAKSLLGKCV